MFRDIRDPSARVRAVCEYGCRVEVDNSIPPKRYFRSGLEMIRMANVYMDEGDLESAFVLYSKYVSLFVEKLPKHPDYKTATSVEITANKQRLKRVFPLAEVLKQKLLERYVKEESKKKEDEKRLAEIEALESAKRQAEEERKRKEKEQELEEQANRRSIQEEQFLLEQQRQLEILKEQERIKLEEERKRQINGATEGVAAAVAGPGSVVVSTSIPDRPPPSYGDVYAGKVTPSAPGAPAVDRSTKPSHFTDTGATTQNLYNLRDMVVPSVIVEKFLNVALPNTNRNVETCGILSGKVSKNAFSITHLLIPKQTGSADTCSTEGEEDIFMYQDSHNLITLGWIHTHPSQTAFLSSVDLHTHCSYQQLLPEAIAIVCAPKFQENGFFYLTPNHGLSLISGCRQRGFHEHPKHPALFEDASHVRLDSSGTIEVVDLRK